MITTIIIGIYLERNQLKAIDGSQCSHVLLAVAYWCSHCRSKIIYIIEFTVCSYFWDVRGVRKNTCSIVWQWSKLQLHTRRMMPKVVDHTLSLLVY